jgi:hypothetical protein
MSLGLALVILAGWVSFNATLVMVLWIRKKDATTYEPLPVEQWSDSEFWAHVDDDDVFRP